MPEAGEELKIVDFNCETRREDPGKRQQKCCCSKVFVLKVVAVELHREL